MIAALASKSVDISLNGSSPTAAGYSRGIPLQVIYIYDNINDAEALVVKKSIKTDKDLVGKKIAVPFGSTTHFHMMFALESQRHRSEIARCLGHVTARYGGSMAKRRHRRWIRFGIPFFPSLRATGVSFSPQAI